MPTVHRCSRGNWTRGNRGTFATDCTRGGRGLWPQVLCLQALAVAGVAIFATAAAQAAEPCFVKSRCEMISAAPPHIDCERIARQIDRAICADAAAAKADDALRAAYAHDMKQLSSQSGLRLRDSQRSFLRATDELCTQMPGAPDDIPTPKAIAVCVAGHYQKRATALTHSVFAAGNHLFYTLVTYRARIAPAGPKNDLDKPFAVIEEDTLVQIDSPINSAEVAWNTNARAQLKQEMAGARQWEDGGSAQATFESDDYDDVYVTQALVSASPDLIVSTLSGSTYWAGAAHPREWDSTATSWSLTRGRALTASDILDLGKMSAKVLTAMAQERLKGLAVSDPPEAELRDTENVRRWQPMPDGLHIVYIQYELGGYLSAADATVPWAKLKPYLRKDLPFDPAKLEVASGIQY